MADALQWLLDTLTAEGVLAQALNGQNGQFLEIAVPSKTQTLIAYVTGQTHLQLESSADLVVPSQHYWRVLDALNGLASECFLIRPQVQRDRLKAYWTHLDFVQCAPQTLIPEIGNHAFEMHLVSVIVRELIASDMPTEEAVRAFAVVQAADPTMRRESVDRFMGRYRAQRSG